MERIMFPCTDIEYIKKTILKKARGVKDENIKLGLTMAIIIIEEHQGIKRPKPAEVSKRK
jgi:hypothetical protein